MKPLSELFYLENDFYVCTFGRWTGWGMNQGHVSFILWCKKNMAKTPEDHEFIDALIGSAMTHTDIYRRK